MYLGSFSPGATVRFMFSTNLGTGARADPSSAWETADIRVYKDGSATQRASEAGYTVTSTFDSLTGITSVAIDTSDNTDDGFFVAGSEYVVVLYPDETVDSVSVAKPLAHFSLTRLLAPASINNAAFAADSDKYQAKISFFDDEAAVTDRYVVAWFKNGQPITSGITTPLIQVVKVADGTDLVASTAMTQIASTGLYRYSEATNRIVAGVAYFIIATATIGGSARTWNQPTGRDSA